MNNDSKKTFAVAIFAVLIACLLLWPLATNGLRPKQMIIEDNREIILPPGDWPPPLSEEEFRKLQEEMRRARAKDGGNR